ncbi:MAG: superoxide dismutase [Fe] [Gammaproteobacteria bacterium]|nr:superoxide dismutase [Fe] [Gammaproteobacteria bacterium]
MENKHTLPELPYAMDALAPYISKETLEYHHGKHHAAYVAKLNDRIKGTEFENKSLEDIVMKANDAAIFNNAAQAWNHAFYWKCLCPPGEKAVGDILDVIARKFRSLEGFKTEFDTTAANHFGSGWTWLVMDKDGKLAITSTHDADTPLRHGQIPLLTCDVWEHAYYIDYRNARPEYLKGFWQVVNWKFVNEQFKQASRKLAA